MKVWLFDYHPANDSVEFVHDDDFTRVNELLRCGEPLAEQWSGYEVRVEKKARATDLYGRYAGALVINKKAKLLFEQDPDLNVEFLPLKSESGEVYYLLRPLSVLNCIDRDRSKKTSVGVDEYSLALYEEIVGEHRIFNMILPDNHWMLPYPYVTDELKEKIEEHLTGYQLIEIWDSEMSWEEKEFKFEQMSREVDESLVEVFDFDVARKYVIKNKGKWAYSGKWALKVNEENDVCLGELQVDGTYHWMVPIYYPPIILGLRWGVMEKRESWLNNWKKRLKR